MIFISVFILIFCYKLYRRFRFKIPPGPRPWPVVGNLYQMNPVWFRCFADWAQSYGPILSVWFGSRLNVVVSSSELAREVLKDNDLQLADRHRNRIATELSRNGKDLIWADYGPHYVKVRKVCSLELFSAKRLDALCPIREDDVRTMIGSIFKDCTNTPGKRLLLRKYLGAVALNHITRVVFGKSFVDSEGQPDEQGLKLRTILNNGAKLGQTLTMAEHIPWLRWMFLLYKEAYAKQEASRSRFTMGIIDEHTKAREESAGGSKQNFVDALLSLKDQYHLSEDTIVGLLWDMIVAGMDTVAISVEWAMAELVKNPRVQKKAQEELDGVIGFERVMIESDFSSLSYLHCVVKEALRLHPPTPLMLPHRASANVKIGGYDIPKESVVHVNVWAITRDPNVWKDPLEFRPERFLEEDVDVKGHDFRLLPFGSGRRVCPGAQLGINLVTSMLGHLLHHFYWASPDGVEAAAIDMSHTPGLVTYMRTPLQAAATPRLSSHLYKRVPSTELN